MNIFTFNHVLWGHLWFVRTCWSLQLQRARVRVRGCITSMRTLTRCSIEKVYIDKVYIDKVALVPVEHGRNAQSSFLLTCVSYFVWISILLLMCTLCVEYAACTSIISYQIISNIKHFLSFIMSSFTVSNVCALHTAFYMAF